MGDAFTPAPLQMAQKVEQHTKGLEAKVLKESADKTLSDQEKALEAEKNALRSTLESNLTGQQRGLQSDLSGSRSQLLAQLQRLGVRGASQAKQLRAFESQRGRALAANRFAGQLQTEQMVQNLRNQRVAEISQKDMALRQQHSQHLNRPGIGQVIDQGNQIMGGILGAAGTAAGTAFGGPVGGAVGNFATGLFAPKSNQVPQDTFSGQGTSLNPRSLPFK